MRSIRKKFSVPPLRHRVGKTALTSSFRSQGRHKQLTTFSNPNDQEEFTVNQNLRLRTKASLPPGPFWKDAYACQLHGRPFR